MALANLGCSIFSSSELKKSCIPAARWVMLHAAFPLAPRCDSAPIKPGEGKKREKFTPEPNQEG